MTKVKASGADAVFFGGYYAEAALLVKQLRDGGFEGTFMSADGSEDPGFVKAAGEAAEGAIITCPCSRGPGPGRLRCKPTRRRTAARPGTYSAEAYDAANIFLAGSTEGIETGRPCSTFINELHRRRRQRRCRFDENGDRNESTSTPTRSRTASSTPTRRSSDIDPMTARTVAAGATSRPQPLRQGA